jgi:uncharacterized membrane protein
VITLPDRIIADALSDETALIAATIAGALALALTLTTLDQALHETSQLFAFAFAFIIFTLTV